MGDLYGPLLLVLFVALAAALYIWNFVRDERERKRVVQYCAAMGWRYTGEDDSLASAGTHPLRPGRPPARPQRPRRHRPRPLRSSRSTTSTTPRPPTGKGTGTHDAPLRRPVDPVAHALAPGLQVTPDGLLDRAAQRSGSAAASSWSARTSTGTSRCTARDPKFASDVLTPRTMEALLARAAAGLADRDGRTWSPGGTGALKPVAMLASAATPAAGGRAGIPSFVWHDNGSRPVGRPPPRPLRRAAPTRHAVPVRPPAPVPDRSGGSPATAPGGQDVVVGAPGVENALDHGTVFGPHHAAPATVQAPPTEGSSA